MGVTNDRTRIYETLHREGKRQIQATDQFKQTAKETISQRDAVCRQEMETDTAKRGIIVYSKDRHSPFRYDCTDIL